MSLVLTVVAYRGQPPAQPASQRFEGAVITLGRAADNDWVLPDPDQHLSKKHCTIQLSGGQYVITDTSTNGVYINASGQPLGAGRSAPLNNGDRLYLGDYELAVTVDTGMAAGFADPGMAPPFPSMAPGFADNSDPFGLGSIQEPTPPASPPGFGSSEFSSSGFPGTEFSPFAVDPGPIGSGITSPAGFDSAPLIPENQDWLGGGAAPPEDPWQKQYSEPDHLAAERGFFSPPNVSPTPDRPPSAPAIPEDWDALMPSPPGPAPEPPMPPQAMPSGPAMAPAVAMPATAMPMPPMPPSGAPMPPAAVAPMAGGGGEAALLAAFLEGAGLPANAVPPENAAATMRAVGQAFREMTNGLREVLTTRAMIKTEYRVEQTVIRSQNNNPLKFSVDAEQAIAALIGPPRPGYMPALQAVQEGFKDLKAHELALMAGMQVAVSALFKQFDPEELKKRLEQNSILHSIVPGARKAKYWEIYEQQFKEIAGQVSEDVHGTFGRAFARAYEEQVRKL